MFYPILSAPQGFGKLIFSIMILDTNWIIFKFLFDEYDNFKDVRSFRLVNTMYLTDMSFYLSQKSIVKLISRCDLSLFDIDRNIPRHPSWLFASEHSLDTPGDKWVNQKTSLLWTNFHSDTDACELIQLHHRINPDVINIRRKTQASGIDFIECFTEMGIEEFYL